MNLLRTLATVSSLTMVSRILGYARDFFIARAFGASLATDAFFVAFKIPNLLRRLFAEGAFSQAFVPILAEYRNRASPQDTKALIDIVSTLLLLALVVAAALGVVAAPLINGEPGGLMLEIVLANGEKRDFPVPAANTFKRTPQ